MTKEKAGGIKLQIFSWVSKFIIMLLNLVPWFAHSRLTPFFNYQTHMQFSKYHFHSRVKLSGIQFSLHLVKMHSWKQLISSPDLHPTTVQCTKVFLNYPEVTGTNYITIKYCVLLEISFNPLGYIQNFISPIQLTIFTLKWPKNSL